MTDELQASRTYTNFDGFNALRAGARNGNREALEVAAKQFEAHLVQQLLRASREASPKSDVLGGESGGIYEDMFDKQMALSVTSGKGLGIADLLIRQLGDRNGAPAAAAGAEDRVPPSGSAAPAPSSSRSAGQAVSGAPALAETRSAKPLAVEAAAMRAGAAQDGTERIASAARTNGASAGRSGILGVEAAATARAEPTPVRFNDADEFVAAVMPHAIEVGAELGTDPRLLVAQAALETGWGRSIIRNDDGTSSHNLFNIKAHRSWDGPVAAVHTREFVRGSEITVQAEFRSYDSFADSFRDYVDFLRNNPRYREALTRTEDPEAFARSLQAAGYATDPAYADKIMRIYGTERLAGAVA